MGAQQVSAAILARIVRHPLVASLRAESDRNTESLRRFRRLSGFSQAAASTWPVDSMMHGLHDRLRHDRDRLELPAVVTSVDPFQGDVISGIELVPPAKRDRALGRAPRNALRRAPRPRTRVHKPFRAAVAKTSRPLANSLAIHAQRLCHARNRRSIKHCPHHPHSTSRRHCDILLAVHLGLLVGKSEDLAVISFSQLDRGDNVLKFHI